MEEQQVDEQPIEHNMYRVRILWRGTQAYQNELWGRILQELVITLNIEALNVDNVFNAVQFQGTRIGYFMWQPNTNANDFRQYIIDAIAGNEFLSAQLSHAPNINKVEVESMEQQQIQ